MKKTVTQQQGIERKATRPVVDVAFLMEVLSIQTTTKQDSKMYDYLERLIGAWQTQGMDASMVYDSYGNLYVTKGKPKYGEFYPTCVAHTDTVHSMQSDLFVVEKNGRLKAYNRDTDKQVGIGGDDKVGVYCALEYLRWLPAAKVAFFRHEETGCQGSQQATMDFFDDSSFVLQADRRGYEDFIDTIYGCRLGSKAWYKRLQPIWERYGRKREYGMLTDVYQLKKKHLPVSCANVSCGYYEPHSDKEWVNVQDVNDTLAMFLDIAEEMGAKRWDHAYDPKYYSEWSWRGNNVSKRVYSGYSDGWDDYYDNLPGTRIVFEGNKKVTVWSQGEKTEYDSYDDYYQAKFGIKGEEEKDGTSTAITVVGNGQGRDRQAEIEARTHRLNKQRAAAIEAIQSAIVAKEMEQDGLSSSRFEFCDNCGDKVWTTRIGYWCNTCQDFYERPEPDTRIQPHQLDETDEAPEIIPIGEGREEDITPLEAEMQEASSGYRDEVYG